MNVSLATPETCIQEYSFFAKIKEDAREPDNILITGPCFKQMLQKTSC